MTRIAIFEDEHVSQFFPLTLLRPVFDLRCGHFSTRERIETLINPEELGLFVRRVLADSVQEAIPAAHVNSFDWLTESTMFVNGRWLADPTSLGHLAHDQAGWIGDQLAYVTVLPDDSLGDDPANIANDLRKIAEKRARVDAGGLLAERPWDLISHNPERLTLDFRLREPDSSPEALDPRVAIVGPKDGVYIHPTARLDPFVVIDSTHGPVWIDEQARIQAFTRIEGPAFIGAGTQLFRANIREGCSIGPVCRVGGEIEESIIQGYTNKYHDGFLGHSYLGSWVNLGAQTVNSDLKNDYSSVKVPLHGESIDSGSSKVGCFIGDHTKTAIHSPLNTGTSIGVMCLVLPGGGLLPKHVPSFSRVWHGRIEPLPDGCESGIATASYAMARRDQALTPAMEALIRHTLELTENERDIALTRQKQRS